MFSRLRRDISAVKERDPAATNVVSVLLNYPGLHAVWAHRVNHALHRAGLVSLARVGSQAARFFTGIEIHPGATVGEGFFIDHGMGVVIGETTVIHKDVTLYQGVTLGGTGKEKGKRHPTLEDCVVVGVGATVLGDITMGRGTKVGAGAVVINDVPPNCTVVGVPGRVVVREGRRIETVDLHHEDLPDPVVEMYRCMQRRIDRLEARLAKDEDRFAEAGQAPSAASAPSHAEDAVERAGIGDTAAGDEAPAGDPDACDI